MQMRLNRERGQGHVNFCGHTLLRTVIRAATVTAVCISDLGEFCIYNLHIFMLILITYRYLMPRLMPV